MWRKFLPLTVALSLLFTLLRSAAAADYSVTIKKAGRQLELRCDGQLLKTYRIALGLNPAGAKEWQGDRKTPEGRYFICNKNPRSRFYLSLGLNYPNADDARRGLAQGLITKREHDLMVSAEKAKKIPPWNTRLGGEVFLHGHGADGDWTWGCVALDNADMKELYDTLPVGAPVEILP
jgi:murein L,D-transpeptidase YafK